MPRCTYVGACGFTQHQLDPAVELNVKGYLDDSLSLVMSWHFSELLTNETSKILLSHIVSMFSNKNFFHLEQTSCSSNMIT